MPDLCRYCTKKGKQSLCVEGLRELGIFKPGIDATEPAVVLLKARLHLLTEAGNKRSVFYNPARGAGVHELTSGYSQESSLGYLQLNENLMETRKF